MFQKTSFHSDIESLCLAGKNVLVNAGPGSGKTTSIVKVFVPAYLTIYDDGAAMTFNTKNAYELKAKLPVQLTAGTCHAYMCQQYKKMVGKCQVEVFKPKGYDKWLRKHFNVDRIGKMQRIIGTLTDSEFKHADDVLKIVRFMQYGAFGIVGYPELTASSVYELMEDRVIMPFQEDTDKNMEIAELAVKVLTASLKETKILDWEDMLYFPIYFNCPMPEIEFLVYDEGQDCKPIEMEFLKRLAANGTKICIVGDTNQAINYWCGAMPDAFDQLQNALNVSVSPMPVSYRASHAAAALANEIFPDSVIPCDTAKIGSTSYIDFNDFKPLVGEFDNSYGVLARVHKFLFPIAMQFLSVGKEFSYKGIVDLVQKMNRMLYFAGKASESLSDMRKSLTEYQAMLEDKHVKVDGSMPRWVLENGETTESLCLLLATVEGQGGDITNVKKYLKALADMEVSTSGPTLSTIHSSKGAEWPNVFIVGPMESPLAKTDKELMAERKLGFVAVTRSSDSITFVSM